MIKFRLDKRLYITMAIIFIALVAVFVSATCCIINMRYAINTQIYSNLEDVADQTDSAIEKRVELYVDLMNNLRGQLEDIEKDGGDPCEDITKLKATVKANGLVRAAFCDEEGRAYSTDQYDYAESTKGQDLKEREFYKRGIEGKSTITEMLDDRLGTSKKINIITSPWYAEDGKIRGVFGITFYSERIGDLLQVEAFEGDGRSFAVNESGEIVIDSVSEKGLNGGKTDHTAEQFADVLNDESNGGKNEKLENDPEKDSKGVVYIDGEKSLYYQKTLSFECLDGDVEWHIFTVVSQNYVHSRFFAVNFDFYTLVGVFIIIFIISIAAVLVLARRYRSTVEHVAYVDAVTGGDNYPSYVKRIRAKKGKSGAFVCLDMIGFNSVRIAVGPSAGNGILKAVHERIEKSLGSDEFIAHVDRDNFALFLSVTDTEQLQKKLQNLSEKLSELSKELNIPHLRMRCGSYVTEKFENEDVDDCYNRASQANEMARRKHRPYWLYDERDNEQMLYEHELAGYFHEAIEKEEFEVWYQPKYGAGTEKIVGAEALVRWRRNGELIPPDKFIPLFENNGMIAKLDEYMFRHVCAYQKSRIDEGKKVVPVSVNLSRATMYNDNVNIVDKYMGIIHGYGVDVKYVQIEITESAVIGKYDLTFLLQKFRSMDEHILLDDFGTGYSSISMLCSKCFDTLKVDKSLVDNIGSKDGETLVSSIIQMAHELGMSVTAEGVETKPQYDKLCKFNCDDIQGFYFSRPIPADEYSALLDEEK